MGKSTKTTKTQKKSSKKAPAKTKSTAKPAKSSKSGAGKSATSKSATSGKGKTVQKKDLKETKVSKKVGAGTPRKAASGSAAAAEPRAKAPGKTSKARGSKGGASKAAGGATAAAATPATPPTAPTKAPAAASNAEAAGAEKSADKKKVGPKGITIVTPKPSKPSKPKAKFQLPQGEPLLKPGAKWKPLIPSGPSAPPRGDLAGGGAGDGAPIKTKLTKKELERYRQVLLAKRAELVGDVRNMESEALLQNSGSLSHTPQHMAEQGTDVFDQSLNLDLAAVDRTLIREIDAALERIEAGTFGVCELSGKLISAERLDELPWTRYSIEAARERERRSYQP